MQPEENAEEQIPQPSHEATAGKAEPTSVETKIPHPSVPLPSPTTGEGQMPEPVTPASEPPIQQIQSEPTYETEEPKKEIFIDPSNPNKIIEKHGTDVTITEVMTPEMSKTVFDTSKQRTLWKKFLEKVDFRKRKRLEKVMNLFNHKEKESHSKGRIVRAQGTMSVESHDVAISNDDVEKLLRVSDSTARRYLDSLEKEGKILQVGKAGKYTHYIKI